MYRSKLEELKKWKNSKNRKPLIVYGARQVGKTWLMQEFGKQNYEKVAYISCQDNPRIKQIFDEGFDIPRIIQSLKLETWIDIDTETLLILDEVQEAPKAITALKYFNENAPEYHIMVAGSLLGVAIHPWISFPVGKVNMITLQPMSFFEFFRAVEGNEQLLALLTAEKPDFEMIKVFKGKCIDLLKLYYFIGGMPGVVQTYLDTKSFNQVRQAQKDILNNYQVDFSKHAPIDLIPRMNLARNSIPAQLSKENKKFIYGLIREWARAKEFELALTWLEDANLIRRVTKVNSGNLPLVAYQDFNAFKVYFLDIGLLSAMANLREETLLEGNKLFKEFKGALTEQFVLQELQNQPELSIFYWAQEDSKAEIDFIIQTGNSIAPIEVKAEENLQSKSLKAFAKKYPEIKKAVRTSMSDFRDEGWLVNIPLYLISQVDKLSSIPSNPSVIQHQ